MARIKRVVEQQNLSEFDFFVQDTDPNSLYFAVTDLPQTLTGGKNGFLITGTRELELDTTVKIEILDVDGNPVYYEIAQGKPEYYEGRSKVVSVWVYNDTPIGVGKITIIGELRKYYDVNGNLRDVPAEWRGNYNVKWERPIMINSKLANETRVRFKNRPIISVSEVIANVKTRQATTVQHSGSMSGSAITPADGKDWYRYRGDTDYRLVISGSTWNDLIVANGGTVQVSGLDQGYVTKVKKILSDTTALATTPYYVTASNNNQSSTYKQAVTNFSDKPFVASYVSESFQIDAFNEGTASFARVVITDLETFSGDVHRVKLFRRPVGSTIESDFELIQDQIIESREILSDESKIGRDFRTGVFRDQNVVDTYWTTSSIFLSASHDDTTLFHSVHLSGSSQALHFTSGSTSFEAPYVFPTASAGDFVVSLLPYASRSLAGTTPYTSSVFYESQSVSNGTTQSFYVSESLTISVNEFIANSGASTASLVLHEVSSSLVGTPPYVGSVYNYSSSIQSQYDFYYRTGSTFTTGSEYNLSAFVVGYGQGSLELYLTGSAFYNRSSSISIQDNGSGKLIGSVVIDGGRVEKQFDENFESDTNGSGVVLFKARGGHWYINDVSLSEYFETNFSPNRFETIIQSPTTVNNQGYEFKAEFFDVNSNRIDVTVISDRQNFFGGASGRRLDFTANKAGFTFTQPDVSGSFTRTATPSAQTIEFTTTTRGLLTGSVTYTSQAFDNSGSAIPASAYVTASYVTYLTNATHSVATAVGGSGGDFSNATGSFKLYHGDNDLSLSSSFGLVSVTAGMSASIDSTGLYTASLNDSTDSGTATFSASIEDTSYNLTFTLSKDKTGNSEQLFIFATPDVIAYQETGSILPTDDTVTFTIQQAGLSGTIVSGDFTVTKNDGTRILTSSLSGTVVGGTGNQTFTASFAGNNSSSFSLLKTDFPLTASVTKDSITDTLYLYSVYGADTYPGTMTDLTDSGGTLTVANYTGSNNGYVVDSVQITATSEGLSDVVTILSFTDGASGRVYFIRPKFGTVLKNKDGGDPNNPGNLEIEIVKTTDNGLVSQSADLGSVKLYSASVELNAGLNGITAGSFLSDVRYNARISGSAITGSLLLSAEDTGSGIVYDTITLADLQDGVPAGYVTANTRVIKRNPNDNTYNINSLGLTASFYIPNSSDGTGTTFNRYVSIDPQWSGTQDQMSWSYDAGGTTNITAVGSDLDGGTVAEDAYATTTDLSLTFTYTDPTYGTQYTTEETFYVVTEGLDGSGSINPVAHTILPLSGTFFSTNPNSGLHQPAWLEFRTQMTTSGSTYDITSGSTSYLRRQRDDFNITASGDGITYRITKEEINSLEVFQWYSGSTPTIVDTISVSDITDGTNSVSYLIRPFFGTVLKNKDGGNPNNPGNLEIQLVKVSGSQEYILNSGDVKLYSASVELSLALNGITAGTATGAPYNGSGVLPYHAQISGSAITGSLTIQAISASVVADTITLADLQDGQPAGWVTANAGRVMNRDPQDNNSYTPASLGVTGSFYIPNSSDGTGTTYSRYVGIDSNWNGTLDQMSWSYEPGGSSLITVTASDKDGGSVSAGGYSNTKDLSLTFTYVDPTYGTVLTTEETFLIVSDGTDGEAAPSAIIRLDDNNRTWLYNPNNGSYTPSDTTNGITASFYIGDTLTAQRGWPINITSNTLRTGSEDTTLRSGDWANTTIDVDGGATKNMVVGFTSGSITVREQFNIVGESKHTYGLTFVPENKVVTAGPSGDVISGLPGTIQVYLYVSGALETDYTTWTWTVSSPNLTAVQSTDKKTFTVSNFTPTSLEQAIVSVTASKAFDDYTTTLQGAFTVTKAYQGRQGPGVVYIGDYDDLSNSWPLQNDDVRRDIVTHAGTYYYYTGSDGALKSAISADNGHPTGSNTTAYWGTFSNFAAVATDILLAQDAYIGRTLNIGTDKTTGEANIALNGQASIPYLSIGQATQNYAQPGVFLGSGSVSGKSAKFSISGSDGALLWNGSTLTIQGAIRQTALGGSIGDARGDWAASTQYYVNDLVGHAGNDAKTRIFRVKINHTSDVGSTPSEIAAVDNTGDATSEARYELYLDTGASGSQGDPGTPSKGLSLSVDSFVFSFDDAADTTADPNVLTFTISQQNLSDTVQDADFSVLKNSGAALTKGTLTGTVTDGTGTQTSTLSYSGNSLSKTDLPLTASVTKDSITDTLHIFKVEGGTDGTSAKSLILTVDSSIFSFDDAADTSADPNVLTFTVAQQNLSDTVQDADFTVLKNNGAALTKGSLTGTVTSGTGTQTSTVSYSGNSLSKTDLPLTASVTKDSITDTVHIYKVEGGTSGTNGTNGADGYTVFLTNGAHTFPADASGSVADAYEGAGAFETRIYSGSTQLTYNAVGGAGTYTVGTLTYDPASNITLSPTTNASQRRFTPTAVSNTYDSGSVTVPITDNNNSQTFSLVYTWAKAKAGQSSYTVIATNQSHTFSANSAGTVSDYSGGGTRIIVYEGTNKLIHTTGTTGDGQYKVTVATANNITAGSVSTNNNEALVDAPSNMTADDASIYFNVEINPSIGTATFNSSVTQSFAKSKQGDTGPGGDSGPGVVYRGDYSSTATYYSSSIRRDIVSYAGSYYLSNVNSSTAPIPPTNWTSFGAQFDSVATNILLAQYANITKGLVIGHSATELGGATNPSSSFVRTANATSLTTGQGFFLSSSGEFTIGDFDGARIAISGSTFVISGSNGSWASDGALYARNATLLGFVSSSQGRVGGFDIGNTTLQSIGGNITLDGETETISVRDSSGNVKFIADTGTTLPDPSLTDTITATFGAQSTTTNTFTLSGLTTNTNTSIVSNFSTPGQTGLYDISATITTNANTKVYSGNSTLPGSAQARLSITLQILDVSNNVIAESATRTVLVDSNADGWNVTETFPTTTFTANAELTTGNTYKARWYVETQGGWSGAKAPTSFYSNASYNLDDGGSITVTADFDLAKTIINGGGFQSAVSSTKFLKVQNSTPTVLVSGQLSVSGSTEIDEDLTVTDMISAGRIEVGTPLRGIASTNQLAVRGNIEMEGTLFITGSNEALAEFINAQTEDSGNEVGFFFGAASGSAASSKKPYIAPIVGTGPNFNREFFFSVANDRWEFDDALHVGGTLSKGAGSFLIDHPDPSKTDTHTLWHSFVESPTAGDNLYRFEVETFDGSGWVYLPEYFFHLNTDVQIWVNPVDHFGRAYGKITDDRNAVKVFSDIDGKYNVLVIGTRCDAVATEAWKGVEREKPSD